MDPDCSNYMTTRMNVALERHEVARVSTQGNGEAGHPHAPGFSRRSDDASLLQVVSEGKTTEGQRRAAAEILGAGGRPST